MDDTGGLFSGAIRISSDTQFSKGGLDERMNEALVQMEGSIYIAASVPQVDYENFLINVEIPMFSALGLDGPIPHNACHPVYGIVNYTGFNATLQFADFTSFISSPNGVALWLSEATDVSFEDAEAYLSGLSGGDQGELWVEFYNGFGGYAQGITYTCPNLSYPDEDFTAA